MIVAGEEDEPAAGGTREEEDAAEKDDDDAKLTPAAVVTAGAGWGDAERLAAEGGCRNPEEESDAAPISPACAACRAH